ncbi:hypothetical protein C0991_004481 [Blastosporella zonata]|nr:hypothetical protein C0991_004481 [Blastosporella zonata]
MLKPYPHRSLLALSISVVIHPPLLPRQILTGLFASLSLLAALLFSLPALSRFLRPTLRILTASSGAFSLVLSIALLTHIPAWADIWERLWLGDSESWGTSKEKGLSTAYFILLGAGILTDHVLNKWLGECPDEEWDHFLANYSAELPNDSDRAGIFRPLPLNSLWGRLLDFLASKEKKEEIYPMSPPWKKYSENKISKYPTLSDDEYDKDFAKPSQNHLSDDFPASPAFLKAAQYQKIKLKPRKRARGFKITQGRKQSVKFDQDLSSDSSDGDSEELQHRKDRPWLKKMASINSSSPTLVDHTVLPVYSDYEEDISTPKSKYSITEGGTGWRPEFMKRHSSSAESGATGGKFLSAASHSSAPMGAVPATPSLIKALDRISAAQRDAFASTRVLPSNVLSSDSSAKKIAANADDLPRLQEVEYNYSYNPPDANAKRKGQLAPMWEEFWREVKHKAMT